MTFYKLLTDLIAEGILFQRYLALFLKKLKIFLSTEMFATGRHQKVCLDAIINHLSASKYPFCVY